MKKSYCSLVLLFLIMLSPIGVSETEGTIEVSGYAEILVTPDIAKISFSIGETRSSVDSAQRHAGEVVNKLLALLRSFNINERDIRTTNISVNPSYQWDSSEEEQVLVGYHARREVRVELKDLTTLGKLIEAAGKLKITNINPPTLHSSKREKALNSAYRMAFLNSKSTAETLAEAAGKTLGEIRTIEVKKSSLPRPLLLRNRSANRLSEGGEPNNYLAGEIVISANVIAVFNLK